MTDAPVIIPSHDKAITTADEPVKPHPSAEQQGIALSAGPRIPGVRKAVARIA